MNTRNIKDVVRKKLRSGGPASEDRRSDLPLRESRSRGPVLRSGFLKGDIKRIPLSDHSADESDGTFISGFIRAAKPAAATCCSPSCCR